MTNVAYADFEAQKEENKINVFELEEGYTRISNNILEEILTAGLTQHQLLIVMAVLRKTYGYNKKIDWVSNWQLSELTGLLPHKCSAAKNALLKRKILIASGRFVGINQCVQEWQDKTCLNDDSLSESGNKTSPDTNQTELTQFGYGNLPESGKPIESYPNQVNLPQSGNNDIPKSGKESLPELGKKNTYPNQVNYPNRVRKSLPESGKHKRQTTKENKNNKTHSQLPLTANCAKPEKRKPNPLDCEAYLNAYNEIVGDKLPHAVEASNERKRKLKLLVESLVKPNLEGFQDYVNAFMQRARLFHFGDNDRGWVATFDYLLNRKTLTKIREGTL